MTWVIGPRSVMRVISAPTSTYSLNVAAVHMLFLAGICNLTLMIFVASVIGVGFTVIFTPVTPATRMMSLAIFSASATVAPGTMTCRAASYDALSAR